MYNVETHIHIHITTHYTYLGFNSLSLSLLCHTHTHTTQFEAVHLTSQPLASEEMPPALCEPMSTASPHRDERSMTPPQSMDIAEVAGELQKKLKLEEAADEAERTNPQFCAEYVDDIFHYLRNLEV